MYSTSYIFNTWTQDYGCLLDIFLIFHMSNIQTMEHRVEHQKWQGWYYSTVQGTSVAIRDVKWQITLKMIYIFEVCHTFTLKMSSFQVGEYYLLTYAFSLSGTLEINCSKDIKVQGIIGPCSSLEKVCSSKVYRQKNFPY